MPYDIARSWEVVTRVPQAIGEFMRSAIDQLGERGLAGGSAEAEAADEPFPWPCAGTGARDLVGNPNGEAAMAEVARGVSEVLLAELGQLPARGARGARW